MRMKAFGMKRFNIGRMILRVGLAVALIAIPAISAVAEGPGPVPYPKIVPSVQR